MSFFWSYCTTKRGRVEGSGFGVSPRGGSPLDYVRKRFSGGAGSEGSTGVVRRIIIWKRRGVLKYAVFTKDGKPVNLLNLQNLLNL